MLECLWPSLLWKYTPDSYSFLGWRPIDPLHQPSDCSIHSALGQWALRASLFSEDDQWRVGMLFWTSFFFLGQTQISLLTEVSRAVFAAPYWYLRLNLWVFWTRCRLDGVAISEVKCNEGWVWRRSMTREWPQMISVWTSLTSRIYSRAAQRDYNEESPRIERSF